MHSNSRTYFDASAGETATHTSSSLSPKKSSTLVSYPALPQVLKTRDLVALFVLTLVFLSNTSGVQFGGASIFLYWALGLATFLLPCVYITQWLMKRFPGAGGHYLWSIQVQGRQWSFLSAFCAWLPCVLATLSLFATYLALVQLLSPKLFSTLWFPVLCIVLIVVLAIAITCLPMRWLKNILLALMIVYIAVFALLGTAGIYWLLTGHHAASSFTTPGNWQPSTSNVAVYGIVILALLGADTPLFLSGEISGGATGTPRTRSFVWWGLALSFLAYIAGSFGIFTIVPPAQAGNLVASVQALDIAFGHTIATIATVALLLGQLGIASVYILVTSRMLVVVAADRRLPAALTHSNRYGVPLRSILIQGLIIFCAALFSLVLAPGIFITQYTASDLALVIYNVLQACASVLWTLSSMQLLAFPVYLLLIRKETVPSRQRVLLLICGFIGIVASLIGIWDTIYSSWIPSILPNTRWTEMVALVAAVSLIFGWTLSEIPRIRALLSEQRQLTKQERQVRAQLQAAYERQEALVKQLQESHDEQNILVEQQKVLLDEVDRLYREHAQAALTDAVTGLPNHRAIMSRLDEEIARCKRTTLSCAVLFVDLDHFKQVNDTWGHRAGDAILREMATRLHAVIRTQDFVGRYGGEEFALILTESDLLPTIEIAERLRVAVNGTPYLWQGEESEQPTPIAVTASIGIALFGLHATTREELLEHADQAMYAAKQAGRDCVRVASIADENVLSTNERQPMPAIEETTTVQVLTTVASIHDPDTGDHAHRLVRWAEAIARRLQRPEEELHLVRLAALLHDIGKIGIPDAILHKPGPLTNDEWTIMRQHPKMGEHILAQAGGVFIALSRIVVAHHERWDGQGYPARLAKDQIPLAARILAVVDSFDAMTSQRPYRKPLTWAEARVELLRCAGSQYDPQVVEVFLSILEEQEHKTLPSPRTLESASEEHAVTK